MIHTSTECIIKYLQSQSNRTCFFFGDMSVKNPKIINPEKRLQESVARDIKLRSLEEHTKHQAEAMAAARWEAALVQKDDKASRKRVEEQIIYDSQVAKINNTVLRKQRLEMLYRTDELRFEDELNARGLAFRREKI